MAQAQVETANPVEMEEEHEDMDEDTGEDSDVDDDEEGDEDSEDDSGYKRIHLADIKTAEKTSNLAVFVTVVDRDDIKKKKGKEQFMAEVADETSAVDICVTNKTLFDKFKVNSGLILQNVDWSGNVLFVNETSKATRIEPIEIDRSVVEEAFGRGKAISIKKARAREPKSWVALKGKIVKQSALTKKYSHGTLLTHRQIKLKDRTGSVYVDVWEHWAVSLECGDVICITGCKRKKSESGYESMVTTTRKSCVEKLKAKGKYDNIRIDRRFAPGKLEAIDVEIYNSCREPECYHFELDDTNSCESCGSTVTNPGCYATAEITVTTSKNNVRPLTVFWPQLCQLYSLFGKEISLQSGKPAIEHRFRNLRDKTVKHHTCGNVTEFML